MATVGLYLYEAFGCHRHELRLNINKTEKYTTRDVRDSRFWRSKPRMHLGRNYICLLFTKTTDSIEINLLMIMKEIQYDIFDRMTHTVDKKNNLLMITKERIIYK